MSVGALFRRHRFRSDHQRRERVPNDAVAAPQTRQALSLYVTHSDSTPTVFQLLTAPLLMVLHYAVMVPCITFLASRWFPVCEGQLIVTRS